MVDRIIGIVASIFALGVWVVAFYYFWKFLVPVILIFTFIIGGILIIKHRKIEKDYNAVSQKR